MEFPVKLHDKTIGTCSIEEEGLYWQISCRCDAFSDRVERLYIGEKKLGVLEKCGNYLVMNRRVSKTSHPELPPSDGIFTLHPVSPAASEETHNEDADVLPLWEGTIKGHALKGVKKGEQLLIPYKENEPCPCEPLLCLFQIEDGFWKIPIESAEEETKRVPESL